MALMDIYGQQKNSSNKEIISRPLNLLYLIEYFEEEQSYQNDNAVVTKYGPGRQQRQTALKARQRIQQQLNDDNQDS